MDRVRLSSAEIFLELKEFEIVNSLGLEQAQEETEILVEFVLLAEKGAGFGGESWGWKQGRNYSDMRLGDDASKICPFRPGIPGGGPAAKRRLSGRFLRGSAGYPL